MNSKLWIIFFVCAIIFNASANIVIKLGMVNKKHLFEKGTFDAILTILTNPFALLGITFFGLAFVLYSGVLSKVDLSVAYPIMTGAGFVLVVLASISLFHETMTIYRLGGIAAILLGIILISMKG